MSLINYKKQFQKIEQDVDIIFTEILSTFNKEIITDFIETIKIFQKRITENIQLLQNEQVKNREDIERAIKLDLYEYKLYVIQTKINVLEISIFNKLNSNIINSKKR